MAFDIEMIKGVYKKMAERVDTARDLVGKPLTLSEKILYHFREFTEELLLVTLLRQSLFI